MGCQVYMQHQVKGSFMLQILNGIDVDKKMHYLHVRDTHIGSTKLLYWPSDSSFDLLSVMLILSSKKKKIYFKSIVK